MKKITLSPWDSYTEGTVPAIYDKGLSYEQQVAYLRYHVRELDRHVDELSKAVDATQGNINSLVNKVYTIQNQIAGIINDVQTNADDIINLEDVTGELQAEIERNLHSILELKTATERIVADMEQIVANFNLEIAELHNDISTLYLESVKYLDTLKAEIEEYVKSQVAAQTGSTLLVENPVTVRITSLNNALEDLYGVLSTYGGITRGEYKQLEFTAEEYAEYQLTPSVYYTRALFIFFPVLMERKFIKAIADFKDEVNKRLEKAESDFKKANTVFIPYTGEEGTTAQLAMINAMQHCGTPTVEEYAGMMLDPETYGSYQMTCGDYFKRFMTEWIYENSGLKAITRLADQTAMGGRLSFMIAVRMGGSEISGDYAAVIYIPCPTATKNYYLELASCVLIGANGNVEISITETGPGYHVNLELKYNEDVHEEATINLSFILGRKGI